MRVSEIHALLALLDDPDDTVYVHVRDQLISKGNEVLPYVNAEVSKSPDCDLFMGRLEQLRGELQRTDTKSAVNEWKCGEMPSLWEGVLLVQKATFPEMDLDAARQDFEQLKRDVWLELNDELTALEQVRILNHMIYTMRGIESVRRMPHVAFDALPSYVLKEKKGNPLGLGILYLCLTEALNLPVRGVNLPNHFILAYCDESHVQERSSSSMQAGILFYINPFSGGAVIGPADVAEFLSHLDQDETARQWRPCSTLEIVHRLVQNVAFALREAGELHREKELLNSFEPLLSSLEDAEERSNDHPTIR
ncbi:MAG: hypothetical protein O3B45_03460 [Bacteroidetes bacterium]|nr:hypothetical protein [Bacteroidota bacterium]